MDLQNTFLSPRFLPLDRPRVSKSKRSVYLRYAGEDMQYYLSDKLAPLSAWLRFQIIHTRILYIAS
ncbi:MAG: hypothetical protein AMJ93_11875 [Anaerolineae bacterium SM23_84]|nr:MAG: hypothetical protein AMJ93_11875 [Anaerolineae bacterium SM23_84]